PRYPRHPRLLFLLIRDAAITGVLHRADVLRKSAASRLEWWHLPGITAARKFAIGEVDRQQVLFGIDIDPITGADESDRTTVLRLRSNVSDDESMGSTGKAAVGNQGNVFAETGSHDR